MLPAILVFLPFLYGILCYLIGVRNERFRDLAAVLFTFVELAFSILLLVWTVQGRGTAARQPFDRECLFSRSVFSD